jgi:Ca-activated chloride channel homolog
MSTWTERKITRDLSERDSIEPPEGLLEKLKADIPADLGGRLPVAVRREADETAETAEVVPIHRRQRWLIAASLAAMVGAGLFASRFVMQEVALDEAVVEEESAVAGAPAPAKPAPRRQESLQSLPAEPAQAGAETDASAVAEPEQKQSLKSLGYLAHAPQEALESHDLPLAKEQLRRERAEQPKPASPGYYDFDSLEELGAPAPPVQGGVEGGVAGGVVGGAVGGVVSASATRADANESVPPRDMTFRSAVINEFVKTTEDRLSTFGLDVDTGSYTVARRYLRDGHLPPREAIRVEELVNYFSYGDPPPARGDFALRAEGAASIFTEAPRTYLLRFNVRAREVKAENRKPAVLTFVVDISGSMDEGNRLGLVKQSLGLLLDQLRKDDRVGLVVYGSQARVVLEPTNDRELLRKAVDQLVPEGATNAEAGIRLGYDVAGRSFRPGAINRILLCSDGVANVGATGPEGILERIQREAKRGIELTTLGFGMGNYNDVLMEQLANRGNGRYAYLDDLDESRRVLVEELTGTLQTIAEDAKAQVEFYPAAVSRWRLIGYENRAIADERFRDNTVDAGEIGAGHSVTVLYEVQLLPEATGKIASLHLRYRVPVTGVLRETVHDLRTSDLAADWKDASPGFRLASLVVEFAETLRGSSHAGDLRQILRRAQRVVGELENHPRATDIAEFTRLVETAMRLREK